MERKTISLRICISSFVHCYGKQKSLRIVEKKNRYSGKPYTVTVPNEAAMKYIIGSSRVSRRINTNKSLSASKIVHSKSWLRNVMSIQ